MAAPVQTSAMFLTRKIGKILRGKATATQVVLAATLGGMLGFIPGFFLPGDLGGGFMQAPGLILSVVFLVLVLNANLAVFGLVTLLAKLLSLVTLPLTFGLGRWLLDGPLQGLFTALVNSRVTAWFGLEYYATTGGVVFGLVVGLAFGLVLWRALQAFRRKMADLQESSDGYQRLTSKKSTRFLTWLLFGGSKMGKASYRELADSDKKGLPIRIAGIVVVLIVTVGLWIGHATLAGPFARSSMQGALEAINGATAEIAGVELDLGAGRLSVNGLAVADSSQLERDSFRAKTLELDIGTGDLLRKRFVVETLVSANANHGLPRESPAKRIGATPPPPPPPPPGEGKTLDDYVKDAKAWKERLAQANDWLGTLRGAGGGAKETPEERDVRIERERRDDITGVRAAHLLEQAPTVLIKSMSFQDLLVADMAEDRFDVQASNLSSEPALVAEPMSLSVASKSGRYAFGFSVANGKARVKLALKGLDGDAVGAMLAVGGAAPIKGGAIDVLLEGDLGFAPDQGFTLDLPLQVTLRGTTLSLYGAGSAPVEQLLLPLSIRGALTNPRIHLDDQKLTSALVAAGRKELADQVAARTAALLKDLPVPGAGGAIGNAASELIQGTKTPEQIAAEAKAAAEAAAAAEIEKQKAEAKRLADAEAEKQKAELARRAEEELKKKGLPGGLTDIFGGKKKKDG